MKRKIKKMIRLFKDYKKCTSLFLFSTFYACASSLNVYVIEDPNYLGDVASLKGAQRAITDKMSAAGWSVTPKNYSITDLNVMENDIEQSPNQNILLFANISGIDAINQLKKNVNLSKKALMLHLSHQVWGDKHYSLIKTSTNPLGADMVALPEHAISKNFLNKINKSQTKLIKTTGVCQNTLPEECSGEYEELKTLFPVASRYIVVMLGGDTQGPDGKWVHYSAAEAVNLAKEVATLALNDPEKKVIVLNGPRTGKFNPKLEEQEVHNVGDALDSVTQAFMNGLRTSGVPEENYKLFDFQRETPSMWKATLGLLNVNPTGSQLIIEGGSTASISQALAVLDPTVSVIAYEHGAMNPTHLKHIQSEYQSKRIGLLKKKGDLYASLPRKISLNPKHETAEQQVAQAVYDALTKK